MNFKTFLIILISVLIFYLPVLINPNIILNRNNDLQEFFWPIIFFIKQQILQNHQIPLWNNLFLSGTPLLPDPQSQLFYPLNLIFLILPMNTAFLLSLLIHTIIAGLSAYLAARVGFKFSKLASVFVALLFMSSPKIAGFLEAGHFGLFTSWSYLPFIVLAGLKLARSPQMGWTILLSFSLTGVYYNHLLIFLISIPALIILMLLLQKRSAIETLKFTLFTVLITFGLIAIQLLPQLEWKDQTTRSLLLHDQNVYPKWTSVKEFSQAFLVPWIGGKQTIWDLDPEKWLTVGLMPIFLSLVGFWTLSKKIKVAIILFSIPILILALNNTSPFYKFLLSEDWFVLLRVTTRIWFIPILIIIFLAGFGIDHLIKKKADKILIFIIIFTTLTETLFLSWTRLQKPIQNLASAPDEIYTFLKSDRSQFRVFCTTRCLSQKKSAQYNLQLVDGYSTLQQKNYYQQAWQLTGGYWNYYTLSIPPIGLYQFEKLQPDPISLGAYNVKYVISPHKLTNENFILKKQLGDYLIYQNKLFLPRAYFWTETQKPSTEAPILKYTPNEIIVDTSSHQTERLTLSEVYNSGWVAYLNGKSKVPVQQKSDALRLVDIKPDTQFVDFKYSPNSFTFGWAITFATILLITLLKIIKKW